MTENFPLYSKLLGDVRRQNSHSRLDTRASYNQTNPDKLNVEQLQADQLQTTDTYFEE